MSKSNSGFKLLYVFAFALLIFFLPHPDEITDQAWSLFTIFISTIFAVISGALPVLTASLIAAALAILTGTLSAPEMYGGFSKGFILLILAAFLVARAIVKSGLGKRLSYMFIRRFGSSTLGLAYSVMVTDAIIAPAFPSNTARSGVLYPIIYSLALGNDSKPDDDSRHRVGKFLMIMGMASLTVSSALWLTAMAANPAGAGIARDMGVDVNFFTWLVASIVPSLAALVILPLVIIRIFPPGVLKTPEAPKAAALELEKMGSLSRDEKITGTVFICMVTGWALSSPLGLDATAVALLGLAVLFMTGIYTLEDLKGQGDALGTFLWFAILYTLSSSLNKLGFMGYVGETIAASLEGINWVFAYLLLVTVYVLFHYLFVSQSAQMFALYGVFLGVAIKTGVPPELAALMLLFATNFFAMITPQGSSANVLFAGSGYLKVGEIYRMGALVTLLNLLIYLSIGTPWILFLRSMGFFS